MMIASGIFCIPSHEAWMHEGKAEAHLEVCLHLYLGSPSHCHSHIGSSSHYVPLQPLSSPSGVRLGLGFISTCEEDGGTAGFDGGVRNKESEARPRRAQAQAKQRQLLD